METNITPGFRWREISDNEYWLVWCPDEALVCIIRRDEEENDIDIEFAEASCNYKGLMLVVDKIKELGWDDEPSSDSS